MHGQKFGIGTWVQRNGQKAVVTAVVTDSDSYPLKGISANGIHCSWARSGAAYPREENQHDLIAPWIEPESPAIRDMFAMAALQGMLSRGFSRSAMMSDYARDAFGYADAMIAARKAGAQ